MSEREKATAAQQKAWIERHGITPPPGFHAELKPFAIASGAMRVTDPCYDMDTWCAGTLEGVKNGTWFGTSYNLYDDWGWRWTMEAMPLLGLKYDDTVPVDPKEVFGKIAALLNGLTPAERTAKLPELTAQLTAYGLKENIATIIIALWDENVPADKREAGVTIWLREEDGISFGEGDTRKEYNQRLEALKKGQGTGIRSHWLTAIHEDYKDDPRFQPDQLFATLLTADRSEIDVGVDSGQAGLFDLKQFADMRAIDKKGVNGFEAFYDKACIASYPESRRNDRRRGDDIPPEAQSGPVQLDGAEAAMGYNASSGYGDGSYELRFVRDDAGQVIFANIMFVAPEELCSKEDE